MYTLKNEFGNVYKTVNTEREKEELIKQGYTLVEEKTPETDLDKMTVPELDAYAKEKGIDLTGCGNKAKKPEKIKASITE